MFDLLAPVFAAAGIAAGIVPIVLHMLRRTPSDRQPFSLVRFLRPTLPKLTRRSRIENWPLMLLRILAMLLIAAAFARPFQRIAVSQQDEQQKRNRIAILVDKSASMRREGITEAIQAQLREIRSGLSDSDVVSVSTFSESTDTLISAEAWVRADAASREAMLEEVVTNYQPDWLTTRTGSALLAIAEEISQESRDVGQIEKRTIILLTDFQRGSSLDELKSSEWPQGVEVDLRLTRPTVMGNAGLSLIQDPRDGSVRVRVSNSTDAQRTGYRLQPFDKEGKPVGNEIPVDVAAGQRRSALIPLSAEWSGALIAGVELIDDPHPFDNVVDLPVVETPVIRVAHLGSLDANNPADMRYYLQRVVDGSDAMPVELVDLRQSDGVILPVESDLRLFIASEAIPEGLIPSVKTLLARGGTLFAIPRTVAEADSLKTLLPEAWNFREAEVTDYAMLGNIDFTHPLFSAFSDIKFSDYSTIRFKKFRVAEFPKSAENVHVLARFDSGEPALIQVDTEGGGRIVILLSGWQPEDSQLALSTRFPPLVYRFVQLAYPRVSGQQLFTAGDSIQPAGLIGSAEWTLKSPEGETVEVTDTVVLKSPGTWTLTGMSEGQQKSMNLLVSVAASESRTDPLPIGQLQALGLNAGIRDSAAGQQQNPAEAAEDASQLNAEELESRQKYWKWLLLAGMMCLMLEGVLARVSENRQQLENVA